MVRTLRGQNPAGSSYPSEHMEETRRVIVLNQASWLYEAHTHTCEKEQVGGKTWGVLVRDKESAHSTGDTGDAGLIPGSGRSPGGGHGDSLQYSHLEKPIDRRAWRAAVHGVAQSRTRLKRLSSSSRTVAHQAPLSLGLSRQEYWSGLPCPPPGDLPNPGIEPASPATPALQADSRSEEAHV